MFWARACDQLAIKGAHMTKAGERNLLFTKEHEWVKVNERGALMGITDYAQSSLGDVVYVELPKVGSVISKGKAIGVVESVKAVSDIYAPMSGTVKAVNREVIDHPEKINSDPFGEGWLITIELTNVDETKELLDDKAYQQLLTEEAKQ
jgi:glycine cleavage system H protein